MIFKNETINENENKNENENFAVKFSYFSFHVFLILNKFSRKFNA